MIFFMFALENFRCGQDWRSVTGVRDRSGMYLPLTKGIIYYCCWQDWLSITGVRDHSGMYLPLTLGIIKDLMEA